MLGRDLLDVSQLVRGPLVLLLQLGMLRNEILQFDGEARVLVATSAVCVTSTDKLGFEFANADILFTVNVDVVVRECGRQKKQSVRASKPHDHFMLQVHLNHTKKH